MPEQRRERPPPGRRAGRGAGVPPVPVRAGNLRRLDAADRTADPRTAEARDRRRAGPGRPARRGRQAVPRLLARHAAAPGHRGRPADAARPADPRRADERPRPAGHPGGARAHRRAGRRGRDGAALHPPALRGRADLHARRGDAPRQAGRPGAAGPAARAGGAAGPGATPTSRPDAARVLRTLGVTEVDETAAEAAGLLGAVAPEKVVAALVHDGVPVRGFAVVVARPGGPVRVADRGGLRCQWLRRPAAPRRPRRAGLLDPVPALRAAADLRRAGATRPGWPCWPPSRSSWPIALKVWPRRRPGRRRRRPGLLRRDHRQRPVRRAGRAHRRAGAVPAAGRRRASPATRSPARPTRARCATCSPCRCAAPGCWLVKYAGDRDLRVRGAAAGGGRRRW